MKLSNDYTVDKTLTCFDGNVLKKLGYFIFIVWYFKIKLDSKHFQGSPHGIMANLLDCDDIVS